MRRIFSSYRSFFFLVALLLICKLGPPISAVSFPDGYTSSDCLNGLKKLAEQEGIKIKEDFKIIVGAPIPYDHPDTTHPGHYYKDARLLLPPDIDLDSVAAAFSLFFPKESIKEKLETAKKQGKQSIDLMELLPSFVREKIGARAECKGPNCWNTTLNVHNPSTGIRFTSEAQMEEELDRNYSRLGPGETLRPGDVLVIRATDNYGEPPSLDHTAIYLGNGLIFHKRSWLQTDPYAIETFDQKFKTYKNFVETNVQFYRYKSGHSAIGGNAAH